ncbi:glycosyltransferase [Bacillus cereus]
MATQYDLFWKEKLFNRFHFYDISQYSGFKNSLYKCYSS